MNHPRYHRHENFSPRRSTKKRQPNLADKVKAIKWWNGLTTKERQRQTDIHIGNKAKHTHLNGNDIQLIYANKG